MKQKNLKSNLKKTYPLVPNYLTPITDRRLRFLFSLGIVIILGVSFIINEYYHQEFLDWSIDASVTMLDYNKTGLKTYFSIFNVYVYYGVVGFLFFMLFWDHDKPRAIHIVLIMTFENVFTHLLKLGKYYIFLLLKKFI